MVQDILQNFDVWPQTFNKGPMVRLVSGAIMSCQELRSYRDMTVFCPRWAIRSIFCVFTKQTEVQKITTISPTINGHTAQYGHDITLYVHNFVPFDMLFDTSSQCFCATVTCVFNLAWEKWRALRKGISVCEWGCLIVAGDRKCSYHLKRI